MDLLNKAKQAAEMYSGGGGSSNSNSTEHKKPSDMGSLLTKAMEAADKYHAKEKVAEFAQKRVAQRKKTVAQPTKSTVDKALEAAEDFLAKQGQPPSHSPPRPPTDATKDHQMGDILAIAKEAATKYSKKKH